MTTARGNRVRGRAKSPALRCCSCKVNLADYVVSTINPQRTRYQTYPLCRVCVVNLFASVAPITAGDDRLCDLCPYADACPDEGFPKLGANSRACPN